MFASVKSVAHLPVGNFEQPQHFSVAIPEEKAIGREFFLRKGF